MKTYQYTITNTKYKTKRIGTVDAMTAIDARLKIKEMFPRAKQILITPMIQIEIPVEV